MVIENKAENKKVYAAPRTETNASAKPKASEGMSAKGKKGGGNITSNKQYTSKRSVLIPEDFQVTCTNVKINDIINELKRLNLNYYVNAQAVLLRILLELSLKYYLNTVNESNKIDEGHLEGTYVAALESMRVKKMLDSVEHSNLAQLKKKKIFSIFNGYVHYDSVVPSKDILIYYFDSLRRIIEICLNS